MISENSYIKFLSPKENLKKTQGRSIKLDEIEGVEMEFNMDVTDDLKLKLLLIKKLKFNLWTWKRKYAKGANQYQRHKFLMFGDFLVPQGITTTVWDN